MRGVINVCYARWGTKSSQVCPDSIRKQARFMFFQIHQHAPDNTSRQPNAAHYATAHLLLISSCHNDDLSLRRVCDNVTVNPTDAEPNGQSTAFFREYL